MNLASVSSGGLSLVKRRDRRLFLSVKPWYAYFFFYVNIEIYVFQKHILMAELYCLLSKIFENRANAV